MRLFTDWLVARGGTQAHEGKDAEKNLKAFISEHGSSRFEVWQEKTDNNSIVDRKIIQRAGFKRMTAYEEWEYFILPPVFEKEVIGSLNKNLVKGYLAQRGLMADSRNKAEILIIRRKPHASVQLMPQPVNGELADLFRVHLVKRNKPCVERRTASTETLWK
ncbi:MAG: hypothetical protein WC612_07000 [Bdellovibrionales bacterium]|jgi:uncharacterized protein (DUF927 family)